MAKMSGSTRRLREPVEDHPPLRRSEGGLAATISPALAANDKVRKFSFSKGLFGRGRSRPTTSASAFPGGKTLGDPNNVKLRFDPSYMQQAAATVSSEGAIMRLGERQAPGRSRSCSASLPLLVVALLYLIASQARHAANPRDKLLPLARHGRGDAA
jgi:hypothetical protein